MTVHFAAARTGLRSPVARVLTRRPVEYAANDNGEARIGDALLHAALRHFADHGLGAAREAADKAREAFADRDVDTYEHWLGICRALDRRMASRLSKQLVHDALPHDEAANAW